MPGVARPDASGEPLTWGILSTAQIAADVVPGLGRLPGSRVGAVASRDRDRAVRFIGEHRLQATAYGSYPELLADPGVRCVYVCLPNALHAPWVTESLKAGKHVLCEKPLTPTEAEARELFDLAASRDLVLAEAFMYRHHPKARLLRELAGRARSARSARSGRRSTSWPPIRPPTSAMTRGWPAGRCATWAATASASPTTWRGSSPARSPASPGTPRPGWTSSSTGRWSTRPGWYRSSTAR